MAGRVSQLEGQLIDSDLQEILLEPLRNSLSGAAEETVGLLLKMSLVGLSYGSKLENLVWTNSRTGKQLENKHILLYTLLAVLPSYLHNRLRDHLLTNQSTTATLAIHRISLLIKTAQLVNFLVFLRTARYRSLLHRLLHIHLVPASPHSNRNIPFDFLNRQIIWQSLTDFILFILPLIDLRRLRIRQKRIINRLTNIITSSSAEQESYQQEKPKTKRQTRADQCPICTKTNLSKNTTTIIHPTQPTTIRNPDNFNTLKLPYQVDCCKSLYCYACLLHDILSWRELHLDRPWACWICSRHPTSLNRWQGGH